ncbi:ARM repeat superfamily protein [Pelomyxa schiedti]|nr:ARM repeat superfamily protein [Pelomyxa schiedti]
MNLQQLQNEMKADPQGYYDEFKQQHRYFLSQLAIFQLQPKTKDSEGFVNSINTLSQVAKSYPADLKDLPNQFSKLLEQHCASLDPLLRRALVKALILMRNRQQLPPISLLPLFFKLFRCNDKDLRGLLFNHIVHDISSVHRKTHDNALNRSLIGFMYSMLQDPNDAVANQALDVMLWLHEHKTWNDAKTVNVISLGVFSKSSKAVVKTLHFFLNIHPEKEKEQEEKLKKRKQKAMKFAKSFVLKRKTRSRVKRMEQARKLLKPPVDPLSKEQKPNWPAIELIHDPQDYAKKVFGLLKHSKESFSTRILLMNFVSRLISCHKLILLGFYSFLQRYFKPHQQHITHILAIAAESCHSQIDADTIKPLIKTLANEFVTTNSTPEAIAIGLNTMRAICERVPSAMEKDLLADLIQYRKRQSKGVVAAARGLLGLFRMKNTAILRKRDRGRDGALTPVEPQAFGTTVVHNDVEGIELLNKYKNGSLNRDEDDEEDESDEDLPDSSDDDSEDDMKEDRHSPETLEASTEISGNQETHHLEDHSKVKETPISKVVKTKEPIEESGKAGSVLEKLAGMKRTKTPIDKGVTDFKKPRLVINKATKPFVYKPPSSTEKLPDPSDGPVNKILTQEDFEKLRELKEQYNYESGGSSDEEEDGPFRHVMPEQLDAPKKKTKEEKEQERRDLKKQTKAIKQQFKMKRGQSNKVQARNKPYLMKAVGQRRRLADSKIEQRRKGPQRKKQQGRVKKQFGSKGKSKNTRR